MADILIVDDEDRMRHLLSILLERGGHATEQAANGKAALASIKKRPFDMVISDIRMPVMDGPELLRKIQQTENACPVVFITAFATVESAVEAMRFGAADYITKPFEEDRIMLAVERTLKFSQVMAENRELKKRLVRDSGENEIVAISEVMQKVLRMARRVAEGDSAVLIQGESGTGKELMARFIHRKSRRCSKRFVPINCAAISPQLVESELFGYEKGAFTGADQRSVGKFEYADGGTLFLDEIGDLSPDAQAKLLRALQEKKIRRVGGNAEIPIDVRVVCATNQRLADQVEEGRFREDLFYRINVFPVDMPPLRERREDIPLLSQCFLERCSGGKARKIDVAAIRLLREYSWPGNVRELSNAIERAYILSNQEGTIAFGAFSFLQKQNGSSPNAAPDAFRLPPGGVSLEKMQESLVRQALDACGNNQSNAAKMLGLTRSKFRVLLKRVNGKP